jgi:hypothetical protein
VYNCSDSKLSEVGTDDLCVVPIRITKRSERKQFLGVLIIDLLRNQMYPC